MATTYWLDLFTGETWDEFVANGARVSGHRESLRKDAEKVQPGDHFLCYVTGISRFIGALLVKGPMYHDESKLWKSDIYPVRFPVELVLQLDYEHAIPVAELATRLDLLTEERPGRQ
jgi:hypothetical protein